jgi:hypothetical protein
LRLRVFGVPDVPEVIIAGQGDLIAMGCMRTGKQKRFYGSIVTPGVIVENVYIF